MDDALVPELAHRHSVRFCLFLFVTVGLGGGAACARRPRHRGDLAALVARRRVHAAAGCRRALHPFLGVQSEFLSLHYYLVDAAVCLLVGLLSFRIKRVQPDGHLLQLDQRARRPAALARAAHMMSPAAAESGMTFAAFAA